MPFDQNNPPPAKIMPNPVRNFGIKGDLSPEQMMARAGLQPLSIADADMVKSSLVNDDYMETPAQEAAEDK